MIPANGIPALRKQIHLCINQLHLENDICHFHGVSVNCGYCTSSVYFYSSSFFIIIITEIVGDIVIAIPEDGEFIVTPPLNKYTFRDSNLYPHSYRRPSYLLLVQQFVWGKCKLWILYIL